MNRLDRAKRDNMRESGRGECDDGAVDGEGTHFALARVFGGDSPVLRGR